MKMNIANAFVANSRLQALTLTLLVVAGLAALVSLPRTEDPRVTNRVAVVLTPFPGATAERVEALVSDPIENKLRQLAEAKTIESRSQPGLSVVTIELKDSITDTATVWSRARDKIADVQAELPAEALPSRFDDDRGYAFTRILALRWNSAIIDNGIADDEQKLAILLRYAEELQTQLRGVSGTDLVELFGAPDEEIRVIIDPARASALKLSATAISAAIRNADAKVAAGTLYNDNHQLLVEVAGELDSLERIRAIPLRVDNNSEVIRVGDIASVERAIQIPLGELALVDHQSALVVAARMLPDLRIDNWNSRIEEVLNTFQSRLPANITLDTIFDQSAYTQTRLGDLLGNILLGFGLIMAVLLVTLGLKAALIVALALPLTTLFTLTCMYYYGLPIHQMSVTGLVVALGIMVDNAIVMTDSIQRKRQKGQEALSAVRESVSHLWLPLLGSTLTTILAFAPIVLMPGPAGEFVGGIALSVIFALSGSYLISHTLIAGFGGRFLGLVTERRRSWYRDGIRLPRLSRLFRTSLQLSLRRPWLTIALVMMVPVGGFISAGQLTEQFFPPSDRDMFHIELHLPPQTSLQGTRSEIDKVSDILQQYDGIERVHWFIGDNAPPFYYNMRQTQDGVPYFAQAMVTASDFKIANQLIPELQLRLDDALPEAQILVRKLEQGPPFNAPLEVRLYGPNLEVLSAQGNELRRIMFATEDIVHTRSTLASGTPKAWFKSRDEVTQLAGLSLTDVAGQLQHSLDGAVNGSLLEGSEELPVRIRVGNESREQIDDLSSLYLASAPAATAGQHPGVPLAALGEIEIQPAWGVIPRRNGERVNVIEGYIRAGVLPQTVLQRFQSNLEVSGFALPAGYRIEFGGESAGRNDAVGNLLANIGVIVTLLVVVVVLSFNSFRLSCVIFAVAAQSAGLGFLSVYAFGYPFGFTVIVGLLGLMGLAINAAIVILAELKSEASSARGESEAIINGVMNSSRHIGSTTITTVGGFMPLILAGGGFWPPFAVAIAGGTVLTTLLSFYFVPALFQIMARRRAFSVSGAEILIADTETMDEIDNEASKPTDQSWPPGCLVNKRVIV